jgi:hypothetical protein
VLAGAGLNAPRRLKPHNTRQFRYTLPSGLGRAKLAKRVGALSADLLKLVEKGLRAALNLH